jgi:hypothetical protein
MFSSHAGKYPALSPKQLRLVILGDKRSQTLLRLLDCTRFEGKIPNGFFTSVPLRSTESGFVEQVEVTWRLKIEHAADGIDELTLTEWFVQRHTCTELFGHIKIRLNANCRNHNGGNITDIRIGLFGSQ